MKKHLPTIIIILLLLAGLSLMLYPTVSNWWNSFHQSRAIVTYMDRVAALDSETYGKLLSEAKEYNMSLLENPKRFEMTESERAAYNKLMDISGNGIMGYIEIPSIRCTLIIYHGTEEANLQIAAGHLEGSSLPIGGENTHCVVTGHRGLPSAKLFTNLDQLKKGDVFFLYVLEDTLAYEVDQILVVEPEDISALDIEAGKDLCTLVTCTPYGINSHRLLIRGRRIFDWAKTESEPDIRTEEYISPMPVLIGAVAGILILTVCVCIWFIKKKKRK